MVLSIVIVIIGIVIAGVTSGSVLVAKYKLSTARTLTQSSPVNSISGLYLWFDATSENVFRNQSDGAQMNSGDAVKSWSSIGFRKQY